MAEKDKHPFVASSYPEVFLGKGVLKICSKFTGEDPCRSAISIKLLYNFIEIVLRHGYSSVNLLHIFRTLFLKNTSGRLLLNYWQNPQITAVVHYFQKQPPEVFCKQSVLKKVAKFTGKHLYWSLF